MYQIKKDLCLQSLVQGFKVAFGDPEDTRRQKSITYTLRDAALSGLACMFYKSANLLRYQESLKNKYHRNNLEIIFPRFSGHHLFKNHAAISNCIGD